MSNTFTITDVRIFDGSNVIANGHVTVSDGLITSVAPGPAPTSSPSPIISKPNHTLLPGFVDAHNHSHFSYTPALEQALRFGVTTFMDLHNEWPSFRDLRVFSQENVARSSDYKCAGVAATIEGGWPIPVITAHDKSAETLDMIDRCYPKLTTPASGREFVRKNLADGADYIKLMHESGSSLGASFPKPSLSLQRALIEETHSHGKKAICHSLAMADHIEMLQCGIDGMAHAFFDRPPSAELVAAYVQAGAWLNPTLAAIGSLTTEGRELAAKYASDPRVGPDLLGGEERARMCECLNFFAEGGKAAYAYETVRALKAAGVPILCGSDSAKPALGTAWGLSLHQELFLFVRECGFSCVEALESATSGVARCFGWSDRGRIVEDLRADLVLVEGDPTVDIDCTLNLRGVWREGVLAEFYEGRL